MRYLSEKALIEVVRNIPLTIDDKLMIVNRLRRALEQDGLTIYRCNECEWFGRLGCAIEIHDETDKPKADDFCSFAERRKNETVPVR